MKESAGEKPVPSEGGKDTARPKGFVWLLIAAAILYMAFLLLGPLAALAWGAFSRGLPPLLRELASADALHALKLTLLLATSATVVNLVFGICCAWVLARDDFPLKRLWNGLVDLPFAVSPVIAGFMLVLLFGRNGWFEGLVSRLGIKVVFALPGMFLATTFISLPFVIREVMPVLQYIGTDQEAAAYTLGATPWQAFWRVTIKRIRWALLYGVSLCFARSVGEFGAVLVVSGSVTGLTETSTLFIFRSLDERNEVAAYGMALVLAALSFGLVLGIVAAKRRGETGR